MLKRNLRALVLSAIFLLCAPLCFAADDSGAAPSPAAAPAATKAPEKSAAAKAKPKRARRRRSRPQGGAAVGATADSATSASKSSAGSKPAAGKSAGPRKSRKAKTSKPAASAKGASSDAASSASKTSASSKPAAGKSAGSRRSRKAKAGKPAGSSKGADQSPPAKPNAANAAAAPSAGDEKGASSAGASAASSGKAGEVVVKSAKATLRSKPLRGAKSLAVLSMFTPVEVVGAEGGWKKVKTNDGATGYVDSGALARSAYVSVLGKEVKVRSGPDPSDLALLALPQRYPLRVVDKEGGRVRVVDVDGEGGWVGEKDLSTKSCVSAKDKIVTLREGPGKQFAKRFVADKGALFEVVEEKSGWLRLKHPDGDEGWASAKTVWGWLP